MYSMLNQWLTEIMLHNYMKLLNLKIKSLLEGQLWLSSTVGP